MSTTTKQPDTRGLAGQTIGDTSICSVGQSHLIYRGYEIADLAANATFEEVAHLLLVGHKPTADELAAFSADLVAERSIPESVQDVVAAVASSPSPPCSPC